MQAGTTSFVFSLSAGLLIGALVSGCNQSSQHGTEPSQGEPGQPAPATPLASDDESLLVGDWRGESKVLAKNTAARDEVVVWHIARGSEPGKLIVSADKIVDGKAIPMGALDFNYDREKKQIVCDYKPGTWKLTVKGNTLEGTLTLRDQTVLRHVALEKTGPGEG